jgi:hypothetical protein
VIEGLAEEALRTRKQLVVVYADGPTRQREVTRHPLTMPALRAAAG